MIVISHDRGQGPEEVHKTEDESEILELLHDWLDGLPAAGDRIIFTKEEDTWMPV